MFQISGILEILQGFNHTSTPPEDIKIKRITKIQKIIITLSIGTLILIALMLITKSWDKDNEVINLVALIGIILIQIIMLANFLLEIVKVFLSIKNPKNKGLGNFLYEIKTDEERAMRVIAFRKNELEYTIYWLNLKISRYESRIKLFLGNNVTILSLIGLIWYNLNRIKDKLDYNNFYHLALTPNFLLTILLPCLISIFIIGITFGGIIMKRKIEKYKYQISIIDLALKFKKENDQ